MSVCRSARCKSLRGLRRRLIEPDLLLPSASRRLTHGNAGYRLALDADELDLVRFRDLVNRARNAGSLGRSAYTERCIGLRGGTAAAGATAVQEDCTGEPEQEFLIDLLPPA
ncbi:hypothetical protein ACWDV4_05740 [Micromonospora sp. NPDC003197]